MSLKQLYKGTKLIETIENYALANFSKSPIDNISNGVEFTFFSDEGFWNSILVDQGKYWNQRIDLYDFVVSDWIARVPGLYWAKQSDLMRKSAQEDVYLQSTHWTEFNPIGKTKKVLGGVGTLYMPPTSNGEILFSISAGCNASAGIPMLCLPDILDKFKLKQGDCLIIRGAKWQAMDTIWASKFATTQNIPRGYLVIDSKSEIIKREEQCPVQFHPFSLMEYEYQDSLFYDFVYVTADSKVKNVNSEIEHFFKEYAKKEGRNGEYLLNPNIVNPIFESRYSCPSELTQASEKAKLNLLHKRIQGAYFKDQSVEELMIKLPQYYQSSVSVRTLAKKIGVNVSLLVEDSAVNMSSQLIDLCIKKEIVENLVDRLTVDYPQIFI